MLCCGAALTIGGFAARPKPGQRLTLLCIGPNRKRRVNSRVMSRDFALRPRGRRHHLRQRLAVRAEMARPSDDSDWKLFLLSFAAFFTCIYTLIF